MDTEFIIQLLNSPGWLKFIGDRNVKTEDDAKAYLENGPLTSYRENGFGLYLVERKEDHQPIGMCGILRRSTLENPDIGFAFLPEFNSKGYAFEIASETLTFARKKLKLPTVYAITVPNNERSIKLLEKIGLQFVKTIQLPGGSEELQLYSTKIELF